jgi:PucR C-terminal helix-turn-helix domain
VSAEVQHLLDRLADDIGRSVVINDPAVVMLYSSRHFGDEDPVRVEAMLNRVAGSAAIAHVLAQDVARWTRPGRIPAKPAIGMRARLCVPLRWRGDLLGLLMVIDADDDLPAADRARIDAAAREVAALLVGERAAADAAVAADDALVAELLSLDPAARERAVAALATRSPDRAGWQASEPAGRQAGGQAAEPAGRSAPERLRGPSRSLQVVALRGVTADRAQAEVALRHAVLDARRTGLATVAGPTAAAVRFSGDTMALAERMIAAANEVAGGRFTCVAGVGPRVATLEEAWTSHRHAELATRAIPHLAPGPVVDAATLGAFGLLLRIPELDPTALPAPVATLLAADSRGVLVRTLEAYLRHAGSAPAAADELHIHRTTLHYRLDRVRSITGCDPDDGETRLLLHLGLGVARLLGLLAGEQNGPGSPALGP